MSNSLSTRAEETVAGYPLNAVFRHDPMDHLNYILRTFFENYCIVASAGQPEQLNVEPFTDMTIRSACLV